MPPRPGRGALPGEFRHQCIHVIQSLRGLILDKWKAGGILNSTLLPQKLVGMRASRHELFPFGDVSLRLRSVGRLLE